MWLVKITVFNSKTMQEYRIQHDRAMEDADIVMVYNGSNHFNAAGKERSTWRSTVFACKTKTVKLPTHNMVYNATSNDPPADPQLFY